MPKHWKSRSSPGIEAGALKIKTHSHTQKPLPDPIGAAAFWSQGCKHAATAETTVAGWSSPVARQAHNLKVVGSNPTPATIAIEPLKPLRSSAGPFVTARPAICAASSSTSACTPSFRTVGERDRCPGIDRGDSSRTSNDPARLLPDPTDKTIGSRD